MRTPVIIIFTFLLLIGWQRQGHGQEAAGEVDFFGETILLPASPSLPSFTAALSRSSVNAYLSGINAPSLHPYLEVLLNYKQTRHPDDWLYYQAVRKIAQAISPKEENYYQYTFYKWWFLVQSGYNARLTVSDRYLLFYVQCDETIYNIPTRIWENKQYVCLNYHDYGSIDFNQHSFADATPTTAASGLFSYKVNNLPSFRPSDYTEKELQFSDGLREFSFRIKVNPQVQKIFSNYPVVDYNLQFNMPLSRTTYESLIPVLQKQVNGMKPKDGIEFLMRFTRYAFLFKPDTDAFGKEKRLTPEQTLLYNYSDCEDRAALFFFLVKELYNLPMLVITYPQHVTVAVQLEKGYGKTIHYNGKQYTICEPSPQRVDLRIGQMLPELSRQPYQIAYAYRSGQ